jgi:DNA-binding SARP family transcriptional activator
MTMFCVLGPMEVHASGRRVPVKGTMKQTLLAAFLAARGELVTVETLADELWGTTPPPKMENALQAQVSRIRRLLEGLEPERAQPRFVTTPIGYRFSVNTNEVDATAFVEMVEAIRTRTARGGSAEDIAALRRALTLWRGPVFGGLGGGQICRTAASRFGESRLAAQELLYELELVNGGATRIVPELTELVTQHPLHERFCGLLMVALYRAGRQIDALALFHKLRSRMNEELGIDPSPAVGRFERAILAHDLPVLTGPIAA